MCIVRLWNCVLKGRRWQFAISPSVQCGHWDGFRATGYCPTGKTFQLRHRHLHTSIVCYPPGVLNLHLTKQIENMDVETLFCDESWCDTNIVKFNIILIHYRTKSALKLQRIRAGPVMLMWVGWTWLTELLLTIFARSVYVLPTEFIQAWLAQSEF